MIANYAQAVPLDDPIKYVEYIQSTGSQYIDSGFKPNQNTRVVAKFQFLSVLSVWQAVFGSRGPSSQSYPDPYALFLSPKSIFRSDYNDKIEFPSGLSVTAQHIVDKNKNVCTIDSYTVTNTSGPFQRNNNMYLFACQSGGATTEIGQLRIYSLQVYDNGLLVRDYAPALDPNGTPCMYDKVSKDYIYNAGSGSFTAGPLL